MTSNYKFGRNMNRYGKPDKKNRKCCVCWLLIIGLMFLFTGVALLTIYYVDESVLALVLKKFNIPYNEEPTTEANKFFPLQGFKALHEFGESLLPEDSQYVPVKIVPKKGIFGKSIKDLEITPDAYLLLKEPVKPASLQNSQPVLEGRLILRSNNKKKSLNDYRLKNSHDEILPSVSDYDLESSIQKEKVTGNLQEKQKENNEVVKLADSKPDIKNLDDKSYVKITENSNTLETDSDKIASEIADEILFELDRKLTPETFLSEDGKSIITLPKDQGNTINDDSENIFITSTFPSTLTTEEATLDNKVEEETSTNSWTYLADQDDFTNEDSKLGGITTLPPIQLAKTFDKKLNNYPNVISNNVKPRNFAEKSIAEFRTKFDSDKVISANSESIISENIQSVYKNPEKEKLVMENKDTKNNQDSNASSDSIITQIISTSTTPAPITTTTLSTTTEILSSSTSSPIALKLQQKLSKKFKKPKKKHTNDPAIELRDLTDDDIEILANFFDSVKNKRKSRSNFNKKTVKRSYSENILEKLKKLPKLKIPNSFNQQASTTIAPDSTPSSKMEDVTDIAMDIPEMTTWPSDIDTFYKSNIHMPTKSSTFESPEQENLHTDLNLLKGETLPEETPKIYEDEKITNKDQDVFSEYYDNSPHKRAIGNRLFPLVTSEKPSILSGFVSKNNKPMNNFPLAPPSNSKPSWLERLENEDSEERANRIEHDLQKMIKFVGILSQLDGYFVQRTKAAAKKLVAILDDDEQEINNHHRKKRRNYF